MLRVRERTQSFGPTCLAWMSREPLSRNSNYTNLSLVAPNNSWSGMQPFWRKATTPHCPVRPGYRSKPDPLSQLCCGKALKLQSDLTTPNIEPSSHPKLNPPDIQNKIKTPDSACPLTTLLAHRCPVLQLLPVIYTCCVLCPNVSTAPRVSLTLSLK